MSTKDISISNRRGCKGASSQDLRDIFFEYRLHPFLTFAPEDSIEFLCQFFAQCIDLEGVCGEQRCNDGAGMNFSGSLRKVLEEVNQSTAPDRIKPYFFTHIHQHFVYQHQGR